MEILGTHLDNGGTIYIINCVLVNRRPEMAMEIGFKKWNKRWMSGVTPQNPGVR